MEIINFYKLLLFSLVLLKFSENTQSENVSKKYEKYELKSYKDFLNFTQNFDANGRVVNFYFYGEKNETVKEKNVSIPSFKNHLTGELVLFRLRSS